MEKFECDETSEIQKSIKDMLETLEKYEKDANKWKDWRFLCDGIMYCLMKLLADFEYRNSKIVWNTIKRMHDIKE